LDYYKKINAQLYLTPVSCHKTAVHNTERASTKKHKLSAARLHIYMSTFIASAVIRFSRCTLNRQWR